MRRNCPPPVITSLKLCGGGGGLYQLFNVDVIIYPYPNPDTGLANLLVKDDPEIKLFTTQRSCHAFHLGCAHIDLHKTLGMHNSRRCISYAVMTQNMLMLCRETVKASMYIKRNPYHIARCPLILQDIHHNQWLALCNGYQGTQGPDSVWRCRLTSTTCAI